MKKSMVGKDIFNRIYPFTAANGGLGGLVDIGLKSNRKHMQLRFNIWSLGYAKFESKRSQQPITPDIIKRNVHKVVNEIM